VVFGASDRSGINVAVVWKLFVNGDGRLYISAIIGSLCIIAREKD
jgi:hypothetical protein